MKKTAILLAILMAVSGTAFGAFTAEEEVTLRQFITNKDKIVTLVQKQQLLTDIADGVTNETIPVQLAVLRAERVTIIETRDLEIEAIKNTAIGAVNQKMIDYEPIIDAKEAEISALEAQLV